jgi:NuA3 HAT complex component NTO1
VRAEADITNKPVDTLLKELDGMVDASLEMRQPPAIAVSNEDAAAQENHDVPMRDATEEPQIIVAGNRDVLASASGVVDAESVGLIKTEPNTDANGDAMQIDPTEGADETADVEVLPMETAEDAAASTHTPPDTHFHPSTAGQSVNDQKPHNGVTIQDTGSPPPSVDGYPQPASTQHTSGPLTPPQSNGSLGHGPKETGDVLSEGGLPWYFTKDDLEVQGTTVVEEERWPEREPPQRLLSEELSEMDEETLKDLGIDVNDHTITASPVAETGPSRRRSNPARFRKGVRSSARRR